MKKNKIIEDYLQERSEQSFEKIVKCYSPLVFSVCTRKLGDEEVAKDISQQVFLDFYKKVQQLVNHPNIAGWFYQATFFAVSKYSRKNHRERVRLDKLQEFNDLKGEDDGISLNRLNLEIDDAIQQIPEKLRNAIIHYYLIGYSAIEASVELNITESAMKKRLARGREFIKDILSKKYPKITSAVIISIFSSIELRAVPNDLLSKIKSAHSQTLLPPLSITGKLIFMSTGKKILLISIFLILSGAAPFLLIPSTGGEQAKNIKKERAAKENEPPTEKLKSLSSEQSKEVRRIRITGVTENEENPEIDTTALDRERQYQRIQAIVLAEALLEQYKGTNGRCLIIHHPVSESSKEDVNRMLDAFKEGLGEGFTIQLAPIKDIDMDADVIPKEAMMEMTAKDFNKVITDNSECDMIITMVPLPFKKKELKDISIFSEIEDPYNLEEYIRDPEVAQPLLGVYNGYIGNLEPLLEKGYIGAMSLWRPNPTIDEEPVPEIIEEAFDKRYTIISNQTLPENKKKYPKLFPKSK